MPKNIALTEPPFRNVIVKSMMPLPCLTGSRPAGPRAFSLLELMTALAILAVLAMLSASGWSGWMRSQSLTQAGMKVTGLLDLARQTALTRNTTSALVVLTGGQASVRDRTLRVMYYDTDADQWTALTGWEALPFDIVVAEGEGSPTPPALLSQLDYRGEAGRLGKNTGLPLPHFSSRRTIARSGQRGTGACFGGEPARNPGKPDPGANQSPQWPDPRRATVIRPPSRWSR